MRTPHKFAAQTLRARCLFLEPHRLWWRHSPSVPPTLTAGGARGQITTLLSASDHDLKFTEVYIIIHPNSGKPTCWKLYKKDNRVKAS